MEQGRHKHFTPTDNHTGPYEYLLFDIFSLTVELFHSLIIPSLAFFRWLKILATFENKKSFN